MKPGGHLPVVLVTGTSSGIGLELAQRLQRMSYRTVVTARPASLDALARAGIRESSHFRIRPLDVTDPAAIAALVAEIERDWGGVDILINNAGIAYRAAVEDMTAEDEQLQLATNYLGPMALIRAVLPGMRRKRAGKILNVSSVSGMMAMPTMASYSASKFALEGASEALWYELRPWNIQVCLIQPGFIHSDSFRRVRASQRYLACPEDSPYRQHYEGMSRFIATWMEHTQTTAGDIAELILYTLTRRRLPLRIPATADARFFSGIRRWLPRGLYHRLLYHLLPWVRAWSENAPQNPDSGPKPDTPHYRRKEAC